MQPIKENAKQCGTKRATLPHPHVLHSWNASINYYFIIAYKLLKLRYLKVSSGSHLDTCHGCNRQAGNPDGLQHQILPLEIYRG